MVNPSGSPENDFACPQGELDQPFTIHSHELKSFINDNFMISWSWLLGILIFWSLLSIVIKGFVQNAL